MEQPPLTIARVLRDAHALDLLAAHYPLSAAAIEQAADLLNWEALSRNPKLAWTEELIDAHLARWDWSSLEANRALPWSVAFVSRHVRAGRFTWGRLRWQPEIFQDPALVELCLAQWSRLPRAQWTAGSTHDTGAGPYAVFQSTPWGHHPERWARRVVESSPGLSWSHFSCVEGFPWTADFLAAHADQLDWQRLSRNPAVVGDAALLRQFSDRIDWDKATYHVPWTQALLREFADRISWRNVADGVWTTEILEEFADRISWASPDCDFDSWDGTFHGPLQHPQLEWTPARFAQLRPHLEAHFARVFGDQASGGGGEEADDRDPTGDDSTYWTAYCDTGNWSAEFFDFALALGRELGMQTVDWAQVSRHARTPWSDAFVARHADELQIYDLVGNPHFPMSRHLERFAAQIERHNWPTVSASPGFLPTVGLIERYEPRLDWGSLSKNPNLTAELIDAYAERWDWEELTKHEALSTALVARLRDRIPAQAWPRLARRFPLAAPDQIGSPWLQAAALAGGRDLDDELDDATVAALLAAVREIRGALTLEREPQLEAAIAADLGDGTARLAYAGWLQQRDSLHAALIALMVAAESKPSLAGAVGLAGEVDRAIARYQAQLELGRAPVRWRLGFIDEAYEVGRELRRLLTARAFRFVRGLGFDEATVRSLTQADLATIAELTCLVRLNLSSASVEHVDALRPLVDLRDLRIAHTAVRDLSFVSALPSLRQLSVWDTAVTDLSALREARGLVALHAGHTAVEDLAPLGALAGLVELDLRYSRVWDLRPLDELPALRLLLVEKSRVSDAELARFRSARPDVDLARYADWPGSSTVLPFWQRSHWTPLDPPAPRAAP
ncbi:MAG: TIGR02996 domain-containing protein [Myxococcales bacterium]|nr:TIGR02996 domain-containing protein [Myxococcales bacterium]